MAELERTKVIPLIKPLVDEAQKTRYEQLELKAPTLSQSRAVLRKAGIVHFTGGDAPVDLAGHGYTGKCASADGFYRLPEM